MDHKKILWIASSVFMSKSGGVIQFEPGELCSFQELETNRTTSK